MNIFVLDNDIQKCAEYHVDKHCVKMILESTQLLNNSLVINDSRYQPVYRLTHKNHPCSIWASQSRSNFDWLLRLSLALCAEYTYRYNKIHKCEKILKLFENSPHRLAIPDNGLTTFARCMPDIYKVDDPIQSYRNYYKGEKVHIAKWTKRETPQWWEFGSVI